MVEREDVLEEQFQLAYYGKGFPWHATDVMPARERKWNFLRLHKEVKDQAARDEEAVRDAKRRRTMLKTPFFRR